VPLVFRGEAVGVLAAFDRTVAGPEFTGEDQRLVQAFAASAATAVMTAQNVAAHGLQRSVEASEPERVRWARELHDETLQELAALRISLSSARKSGDAQALERAAEEAIERATAAIDALRHLITDMRPASLDELGAGPALDALTVRVRDDGPGFAPDAHHEGFGLIGIRERVELVGGTLRVESAPGAGTSLEASCPPVGTRARW